MTGFFDINGKIITEDEAHISPFDRGFLLGDSCFEVILVKDNQAIFFADHLERLFSSLEYLKIKNPWTVEDLNLRCQRLIEHSRFSTAYLRITVTRGTGGGFANLEDLKPNLYLYIKSIPEIAKNIPFVKLKSCYLSYTRRQPKIKTTDYQESLSSLIEARELGFDDILCLNSSGEVTESSAANIFFVKQEKNGFVLETPSLDCGILPGVTRLNLIKVCQRESIQVREKKILREDLSSYTACFLSSSIKLVVGVKQIDNYFFETSPNFLQKLLLSLHD